MFQDKFLLLWFDEAIFIVHFTKNLNCVLLIKVLWTFKTSPYSYHLINLK